MKGWCVVVRCVAARSAARRVVVRRCDARGNPQSGKGWCEALRNGAEPCGTRHCGAPVIGLPPVPG